MTTSQVLRKLVSEHRTTCVAPIFIGSNFVECAGCRYHEHVEGRYAVRHWTRGYPVETRAVDVVMNHTK